MRAARRPEVDALIAQGYTPRAIRDKTGVPEATVRSYAKRHGLTLTKWGNPELVANISTLARDGYGSQCIADILEVSRQTVIRHAKLNNIELPKRTSDELVNHAGFAPGVQQKAVEKKRRVIEWSGGRETLGEAAARLGITRWALAERIERWGVEKAMTTPKLPPFYGKKSRRVGDNHPWRRACAALPVKNAP